MATWVTHIMIAEQVLAAIPSLCRHEFLVGNIAPDCNQENEDWTSFTPPREVTHWMSGQKKTAADCDRFLHEYVEAKTDLDIQKKSFLMGYYAHLIADAEFQRFIRDEARVKASWSRIKAHPVLALQSAGMEETFDSVKMMIDKKARMKDIYSIERAYLDQHPGSGYLMSILTLTTFPDYIDYLPQDAIARKIKVMGYIPQKEPGPFPFICISQEEYSRFLTNAVQLSVTAIRQYLDSST